MSSFPNGLFPPTSESLALFESTIEDVLSVHLSVGQFSVMELKIRSSKELFNELPLTNLGIGRAVFVPVLKTPWVCSLIIVCLGRIASGSGI
jgi:hypothetical protein